MNPTGLFAKGELNFGQSDPAGDSAAGTAWLAGGELGYSFASGYFQRFEGGISLLSGQLSYKSKAGGQSAIVTAKVPFMMLARATIGKTLGGGAMLLWNLSVGPAFVKYSHKFQGQKYSSANDVTAFVNMTKIEQIYDWGDTKDNEVHWGTSPTPLSNQV